MDILAALFAYIVCIAGLVTGLVMSFVVFFSAPGAFSSAPGAFSAPPANAIAMVARPDPRPNPRPNPRPTLSSNHGASAPASPVKTITKIGRSDGQIASNATPAAETLVAGDARQKPLISQSHLRRLAEKERARQLAYRERSSFETRFLHFDD